MLISVKSKLSHLTEMELHEFPKNPFTLHTDESIRFNSRLLAWQRVENLGDQMGRYNRHMERVECWRVCNEIREATIKEFKLNEDGTRLLV